LPKADLTSEACSPTLVNAPEKHQPRSVALTANASGTLKTIAGSSSLSATSVDYMDMRRKIAKAKLTSAL
jgi:hypothetical protein